MPVYLDACALAKRYLHEGRSSQTMKAITGRPATWGGLVVSTFVEIEVVSAIARAAREASAWQRDEAVRAVSRTVAGFLAEYRGGAFSTIELTPAIVAAAIVHLRTHPRHEIGAGDAIHLATALAFVAVNPSAPLVFATADQGLYEAARACGLRVYNPNYEGSEKLVACLRG